MDIAYINDRIRQISARIQSAEEDELDFLVLELDVALRQQAWYVRATLHGSLGRLPSPESEQ